MTKIINHADVLRHPFMKEIRNAFKHIPAVENAFKTNNLEFFLGYSLTDFADGSISFEEYFCRNILKKCSNIRLDGHCPTTAAREKFKGFMDRQEVTGLKVKTILENIDTSTDVGRVLVHARELLHGVFADFGELSVKARFTGGATLTLSREYSTSPFQRFKTSEGAGMLQKIYNERRQEGVLRTSFLPFNLPQMGSDMAWHVNAGFVSKYWKEDRLIGFNPSAPLALQVGVGDWMTECLQIAGINISTAQETHKRVARMASLLDNHLMTLDQSNASDNIVRWVCNFFLPNELYEYLSDITPHEVRLDDGTIYRGVHMMATAGNGYIFPLQTAIFWALAKATCRVCGVKPEVYSYGDDLIAPVAIYQQLAKVFSILGLQINFEKTFTNSNVRESCGGDYVNGTDVRPLHVKELPYSTSEWIRCINGIRRVGYDNNLCDWRSNNFRRLWLWCISCIQLKSRLFAPVHYGDSAIGTSNYKLYKLSYKRTYSLQGRKCKYPNDGLHPSGHPYSGWYIETYISRSVGKGRSVGSDIQGIPSDAVMRLLPLSSIAGSGLRLYNEWFDEKNVKLKTPVQKLGYPVAFGMKELRVERHTSPFFMEPPAPCDDINDLFNHLSDECRVKDVESVVRRTEVRHANAITSLLDLLRKRVVTLRDYEVEAENMDLSF